MKKPQRIFNLKMNSSSENNNLTRKIQTTMARDSSPEVRIVLGLLLNGVNSFSKDEKEALFLPSEDGRDHMDKSIEGTIKHKHINVMNLNSKISHLYTNLSFFLLLSIQIQLTLAATSKVYYFRVFENGNVNLINSETFDQYKNLFAGKHPESANLGLPDEDYKKYTKITLDLVIKFRKFILRLINTVSPKFITIISKHVYSSSDAVSYSETEIKPVQYQKGFVKTCFTSIPDTMLDVTYSEDHLKSYFSNFWFTCNKSGDKVTPGALTLKNIKFLIAKTIKNSKDKDSAPEEYTNFINSIIYLVNKSGNTDVSDDLSNILFQRRSPSSEDTQTINQALLNAFFILKKNARVVFVLLLASTAISMGCNVELCYIDSFKYLLLNDGQVMFNVIKSLNVVSQNEIKALLKNASSVSYLELTSDKVREAADFISKSVIASDRAIVSVFKSYKTYLEESRKTVPETLEQFIYSKKADALFDKLSQSYDNLVKKVDSIYGSENHSEGQYVSMILQKIPLIPSFEGEGVQADFYRKIESVLKNARKLNNEDIKSLARPGSIQTFTMIINSLFKDKVATQTLVTEMEKSPERTKEIKKLQSKINVFALAAKMYVPHSSKNDDAEDEDEEERSVDSRRSGTSGRSAKPSKKKAKTAREEPEDDERSTGTSGRSETGSKKKERKVRDEPEDDERSTRSRRSSNAASSRGASPVAGTSRSTKNGRKDLGDLPVDSDSDEDA